MAAARFPSLWPVSNSRGLHSRQNDALGHLLMEPPDECRTSGTAVPSRRRGHRGNSKYGRTVFATMTTSIRSIPVAWKDRRAPAPWTRYSFQYLGSVDAPRRVYHQTLSRMPSRWAGDDDGLNGMTRRRRIERDPGQETGQERDRAATTSILMGGRARLEQPDLCRLPGVEMR